MIRTGGVFLDFGPVGSGRGGGRNPASLAGSRSPLFGRGEVAMLKKPIDFSGKTARSPRSPVSVTQELAILTEIVATLATLTEMVATLTRRHEVCICSDIRVDRAEIQRRAGFAGELRAGLFSL